MPQTLVADQIVVANLVLADLTIAEVVAEAVVQTVAEVAADHLTVVEAEQVRHQNKKISQFL